MYPKKIIKKGSLIENLGKNFKLSKENSFCSHIYKVNSKKFILIKEPVFVPEILEINLKKSITYFYRFTR